MGVDRIILRSFLSTLAAIVLLFAFMLVALIGLYPSTMMEITYDLGMDASSIRYAERAYEWSGDEYFMAYAMEVAIGSADTKKIESCGEKLISDGDFAAYYAKRNEKLPQDSMTYEQYVYGQVCVAKYENGKKEDAVNKAFDWTGTDGFPKNNAVIAVLYSALSDGDTNTINLIKGKMEQLQTATFSPDEKAEFDRVFALTEL